MKEVLYELVQALYIIRKCNGVIKVSEELNEHMQVRREKLATYYEKGIDPFGGKFIRTDVAQTLHELYEGESKDRKSTRLNSSHVAISYAVFCLKKKNLNRH